MTETAEPAAAPPVEDDEQESVTELLEQLGRQLGALTYHEARLTAARHRPELVRAGRDVTVALVAVIGFLTAFVLANAAAVYALSSPLPGWAAALVLAGAWLLVGVALGVFLLARARRAASAKAVDAEHAREEAEQAVRETLERLVPAVTKEIALAAIPIAAGVADGVLDAGEDLLEDVDDFVEDIVEDVPGGSVIGQMWDVVLMPGRLGLRVATAVVRLGDSEERAEAG